MSRSGAFRQIISCADSEGVLEYWWKPGTAPFLRLGISGVFLGGMCPFSPNSSGSLALGDGFQAINPVSCPNLRDLLSFFPLRG